MRSVAYLSISIYVRPRLNDRKTTEKPMRSLETKTARGRLPVSRNPVFVRLGQGVSVGYRRNAGGAGVWIVRLADGKQGRVEKRLALADDLACADGGGVMNYQQAAEAARRLGRGETDEAQPAPVVTLGDALDAYRADLEARGAGLDNVTRLRFNLTPIFLKRPVALLDVTELRKWRDAAANRMAPASVNRLATILKAVLNLAASKNERLPTRPWEIALAALPEATVADNIVLPESTIRRLVQAARAQGPEFGLLVEVLALTGARVSQLARCQVRDVVSDRLMIPSSAKGQKKRVSRTPVPIPIALADKLRTATAGRQQGAPLLLKSSGEPWSKSDHARPFKRAVEAVGEDPVRVTSYSLRHTHITGQLLAGLPVQLVAKLHDTSASQIEKHYAAEITSHSDELVRGAMMSLDDTSADSVVVSLR
jgi:integrase